MYSTSYTTSTALDTTDLIAMSYTHAEDYALLCFHYDCTVCGSAFDVMATLLKEVELGSSSFDRFF